MANQAAVTNQNLWGGGEDVKPLGASYGKIMMWFFIVSDAFTFSGLLISYGLLRIGSPKWANPEEVFHAFPFMGDAHLPLVFVGLMTFILIFSSVTMVLAVEAGHRNSKKEVSNYMILTILGGIAFLACQAWEWTHLIHGGTTIYGNPHGPAVFGQLFFTITGFHGAHVTSGVILNIIVFILLHTGYFDRRVQAGEHDPYELVEKVGLYWHFVDLVWVFVFTFFYLV